MKLLLVFIIAICLSFSEAGTINKRSSGKDWSKIRMKDRTAPFESVPFQNLRYDFHRDAPVYATPPVTRDMRAEGCGVPNIATGRIINGIETGVNELPWQVAVFIDDLYFCGGSLINEQWVLTAAHCATGAKSFEIWLGAHNIRVPEDFRTEIVNVTEYFIHPNYNTNNLNNDVALIKLTNPVTFSDNIRPICLPAIPANINQLEDHTGESEVVSGWGRVSDTNNNLSPVLLKTNVVVSTDQECRSAYGASAVYSGLICVSTTDGHGTCNGDSGGPLSHVEADGVFTQIGLVSFGSTLGCDVGSPLGFTNVEYFRQWIQDTTNTNFV